MSRPKVFVTRPIAQGGLDLLRHKYTLVVRKSPTPITRAELLKKVRGISALLPLLTDKIDAGVMDAAGPQLKIIANYAVGYDNIDLKAATERNIIVTNTPGVLTVAVAEHTLALLAAAARRVAEGDRHVRAGKFTGWEPELLLGPEISGKTLGIVGLGRIGYEVAKRATAGFGMHILYTDPSRDKQFEKRFNSRRVTLSTLLKRADFVSLHVPLLPSTYHLIRAQELKLMKRSSYLINTARGAVIDERALVTALKNKQIAGAALDVFEHEPKLARGLKNLANVTLTPHTASATFETRTAMSVLAAQNIRAVLQNKKPLTPV